ncbi:Uncharacterised protein [Burkholderia pseudomallei]|nr:hypothetical protein [Burkholderia pseudomallei]AIV51895.1 hypothetical protein Y603_1003 [Burkholderia pseudomallei MSHR1153]AIV79356.1 hypothetical protein X994_858 [Burkholderia pseudomallei]AIV89374.1 hypothetical protein X995_2461 [Burkholderia pseudomallei B03]AIV94755.1 hypothetical protein X996_2411 [Burkholderia pseudomallei A79A]KGD46102.1 hypothetical protein DP43_1285 [Burkholderia pseudomallei]
MNKAHLHAALFALGTFALVAFVQKSVMPIPVIGPYLPGGTNA